MKKRPPVKGFWSITPESFGLLAEPHTIEVNVEEWVERKLAGILAHKSQMGDGHPFANLDPADARRWLGREFFRRADLAGRPGAILEQLCT